MADAVQLASALTSLIGATCVVVEYVKKLCESQKSARDLYERVCELSSLLDSIEPVVQKIEASSHQTAADDQTKRLREGIKGCLEGCERSINEINNRLKGFAEGKKGSWKARFEFVFSEREIKAHRATIEGHLQSLHLSLIALNGWSDSVNHAITHEFLQQLLQLFAYLIVTQQQYQPHPANMGIRSQDAAAPSLTSSITSQRRALPALEGPERNLEVYFNPIPWTRREPLPIVVENDRTTQYTTERVEELHPGDIGAGHFADEPVIDTPLALAVKHNQPDIVRTLIKDIHDIEATDTEGWTLVHHAVSRKAFDSLSVLLEWAQNNFSDLVNAQNLKHHTALMLCAKMAEKNTSIELARLLIKHGADVNIEDSNGRTALYMLSESVINANRVTFAELLVTNGASFGQNQHKPAKVTDYYNAVPNMAEQVRRASSVASVGAATDNFGTSPGSPSSSSGGEARRRSGRLSFSALKRRFSGTTGSLDP